MAAMVGRSMAPPPEARERAVALLNDARLQQESSARLEYLKELKELCVEREPRLLGELLPHIIELCSEPASSIRNFLIEFIEEVGIRYVEYLPRVAPILLAVLKDEPPFARRAITAGTSLFRNTLEHVLLTGLQMKQVDNLSKEAWFSMLQFKDVVREFVKQHGNDGVRFHAVKFLETVILQFTPDPTGPSQPPDLPDGMLKGVNLSWIVGGHPLLDAAAMAHEASKTLAILLNQLKSPDVSALPGSVAIVIVNSLAAIAKRRPSYYGRILSGLIALAPNCDSIKGAQVASIISALKNAFVQLLKCSQAGPWREHVANALRQMNVGDAVESAVSQILRNSERESRSNRVKEERDPRSKRALPLENGGEDASFVKRLKSTPPPPPQPSPQQYLEAQNTIYSNGSGTNEFPPLETMIQMFESLAAAGDSSAGPIELMVSRLPLEALADIVLANLQNLPPPGPNEQQLPPPPPLPPMETVPVDIRRDPRRDPRRLDPRRPAVVKKEPLDELPTLPDTSMGAGSTVVSVVSLSQYQRNVLVDTAIKRILEGHKAITAAGGGALRVALLTKLASQSEDALDDLLKHILADYASHMGHELSIYVLYELYDLLISEGAREKYEIFLHSLLQGLRETLPASDKSISKLMCEVPLLTDGAYNTLESLCNLVGEPNSERVTQGLSTLWSLILQRPAVRARCLNMALECAVHELDDVRAKAIRLIANKLHPVESLTKVIEDFAIEKLHSLSSGVGSEAQETTLKEGVQSQEGIVSDARASSTSVTEAQRYMFLYFALCTKKHDLLEEVFCVYARSPKAVKQAIHRQMPALVRTVQSSPDMLKIISDPPSGSENLVLQVLHILTDGTAPSPELICTVKQVYETRLKNAVFLIPVLSSLPKTEVLPVFPKLLDLSSDKVQVALSRILQGSATSGPALTPVEVLIAIHGVDPHRDGISVKKITEAINMCFEQPNVFKQDVLAKVLNQLVEQTPLPMLFMRTVIQTVKAFPALVDFVMEILIKLVNRQIWKVPQLWVGFLKCAEQCAPRSFRALLQLPTPQLENALTKIPALKATLAAHASQPTVRASVPRSSLLLLGVVQDDSQATEAIDAQEQ